MSTIEQVKDQANTLFVELSEDIVVDLTLPTLDLDLSLNLPTFTSNGDLDGAIPELNITALTDGSIDGTGAFDRLMKAASLHLGTQYDKGRITATEYAKAYTEICIAVLAQAQEFVTAGMNAIWQARLIRAQTQLVEFQKEALRMEAQTKMLEAARTKIDLANAIINAAKTKGEMVSIKMDLANSFQSIQESEGKVLLVSEQVDTQRAQTKETLKDGTPVLGLAGKEKDLKEAQVVTATEQIDIQRAQTKETTLNGDAISGVLGKEIELKDEQILTQIKSRELVSEQIDTQRAQTKTTTLAGTPIGGIAGKELLVKTAQITLTENQSTLVGEQYETQRAQARGNLSTGEAVGGLLGAQTALYIQQKKSYEDDAKTKVVKMMMDSWTARKTIDEGVAVPATVDVAAINTSMGNLRTSVGVG